MLQIKWKPIIINIIINSQKYHIGDLILLQNLKSLL